MQKSLPPEIQEKIKSLCVFIWAGPGWYSKANMPFTIWTPLHARDEASANILARNESALSAPVWFDVPPDGALVSRQYYPPKFRSWELPAR